MTHGCTGLSFRVTSRVPSTTTAVPTSYKGQTQPPTRARVARYPSSRVSTAPSPRVARRLASDLITTCVGRILPVWP